MQDYNPQAQGESLDNSFQPRDNNVQDGHTETIDRRNLVPLNDVECKHEHMIVDETDESEEWTQMVCANPKCPYGYLLSK